jgi:hypothetical protein
MKKQRDAMVAAVLVAVAGISSACSNVSSTERRAGLVALGGAAGGTAGYLLGGRDAAKTGIGAVAGAGLTHLALGQDAEVKQEGFDAGYVQGQSDAIKRQYFLRQALEAQPLAAATSGGEPVYYVVPGPEVTADGRKLEPHTVSIRVIE